MKYSELLTPEELEFALHAYATYLMYKNEHNGVDPLPDSEFDSDDCQMWIEDAINRHLASIEKYISDKIYSHLVDLKNSIFKKLNDADDEYFIAQGYYKVPYSYGYVWKHD